MTSPLTPPIFSQRLYAIYKNDLWREGGLFPPSPPPHGAATVFNSFYVKSKFKNSKKSIGAFEKHADDVTSSDPILLKISEVVRK